MQTRPDNAHEKPSICFKKATVRNLKSQKVNVVYSKLGHVASWKILTFAEGVHANLPDTVSSSDDPIVFLVDENRSSCPLIWASNKYREL